MTPRHVGARLGLAAFAERAGVASVTLRSYISRYKQDAAFMSANPVPTHCGSEPISGRRWWCEKHIDQWISNRPRKSKTENKAQTARCVASSLLFAVLVLAACSHTEGVVQDKREHRNGLGIVIRELCLGESKTTCAWHQLRGTPSLGWYRRCDIGELYPDCRTLL